MNINVGDYLLVKNKIKCVNSYIINSFHILRIEDIAYYDLKCKVKFCCNDSIKYTHIYLEELKRCCVKLKVEEV